VKLPNAADAEKKSLEGETVSTELTKVEVEVEVLSKEPSLDKGEKNDAKGNGVAPEDLKSPAEKLAGANGC
jgi:hypothetical protein